MRGVLGRRRSVECKLGGQHVMRTPRLRITTARWSVVVASFQLIRDARGQYWQGWSPDAMAGAVSELPGDDPLQVSSEMHRFVAFEVTTGQLIAAIGLHRRVDGWYDIGGDVDPEWRGEGYGTEALEAICRLAHQHLGIARLYAGCESTNLISRRWLAACGFVSDERPQPHTLPNGRIIECHSWQRVDPVAQRRCRRPFL